MDFAPSTTAAQVCYPGLTPGGCVHRRRPLQIRSLQESLKDRHQLLLIEQAQLTAGEHHTNLQAQAGMELALAALADL
eukprot:CAMPEP_0181487784 /NCGR_PEP_ID=MMETSP1110-20121109/48011_1 /TAXON_ID=174948 /ORGANISM="Symbiodinium sp., Strain CCMP421" /LENGTH=77 /DNA_ID=CAMNT_0023614329 /DNA_START=49 /DNA_END=282 /DNA_ORIENTATION=+